MTIVAYISNGHAWYPSVTLRGWNMDTLTYLNSLRPRVSECIWIIPGTED